MGIRRIRSQDSGFRGNVSWLRARRLGLDTRAGNDRPHFATGPGACQYSTRVPETRRKRGMTRPTRRVLASTARLLLPRRRRPGRRVVRGVLERQGGDVPVTVRTFADLIDERLLQERLPGGNGGSGDGDSGSSDNWRRTRQRAASRLTRAAASSGPPVLSKARSAALNRPSQRRLRCV